MHSWGGRLSCTLDMGGNTVPGHSESAFSGSNKHGWWREGGQRGGVVSTSHHGQEEALPLPCCFCHRHRHRRAPTAGGPPSPSPQQPATATGISHTAGHSRSWATQPSPQLRPPSTKGPRSCPSPRMVCRVPPPVTRSSNTSKNHLTATRTFHEGKRERKTLPEG